MEKWDLYDVTRQKLGKTAYRGQILTDEEYHLAVDVWILNDAGQVLLQQRSTKKKVGAGLWYCTGGAAIAGENSQEACFRETSEELGIKPNMNNARIVLQDTFGCCHKDVWLIHQNIAPEELCLQPDEVDDVKWVDINQLESEMDKPDFFWKLTYKDGILRCLKKAIEKGLMNNA